MTPIEPRDQVQFLSDVQRVLSEGSFVASYKYALLLALTDLSVEVGDDTGEPLPLSTRLIARKVVEYYWNHVLPFEGAAGKSSVELKQNSGRRAKILTSIREVRDSNPGLGPRALVTRNSKAFDRLVRTVDATVREMPLWKLQTVGSERLSFLYEPRLRDGCIELKRGIVFCMRRFHRLITELVRARWLEFVRELNRAVWGDVADLREFLFGSERSVDPAELRPLLMPWQSGLCFYCEGRLFVDRAHVDHFIPWSRYPVDLGHNFVLAHERCNSQKADHIASPVHLSRWADRYETKREEITAACAEAGVPADADASKRITHWAYDQVARAHGLVWESGRGLVPLSEHWREPFDRLGAIRSRGSA